MLAFGSRRAFLAEMAEGEQANSSPKPLLGPVPRPWAPLRGPKPGEAQIGLPPALDDFPRRPTLKFQIVAAQ